MAGFNCACVTGDIHFLLNFRGYITYIHYFPYAFLTTFNYVMFNEYDDGNDDDNDDIGDNDNNDVNYNYNRGHLLYRCLSRHMWCYLVTMNLHTHHCHIHTERTKIVHAMSDILLVSWKWVSGGLLIVIK